MKTKNFISLGWLLLTALFAPLVFSSCKKDPPPTYNHPTTQGRLLNYLDDTPISGATVKLFYEKIPPFNPDEIVTTDANGNFTYKYFKDTNVVAIPSYEGWWCPFQYGYSLNNKGDAFENDSIIYLFEKDTVKVHVHIQTLLALPFTGKFRIDNMAFLPKVNSTSYWLIDEKIATSIDIGTYTKELFAILGVKNSLWFSKEAYGWWSNDTYYQLQDSIIFFSEAVNGEPEFDFYY